MVANIFTMLGSTIGIITGAFVIWERFFRYEPVAFLVAQEWITGGVPKGAYVRLINRSERPIIVSWPTGIENNVLRISMDHSTRAIVTSLLEGETSTAIDGKQDHLFPALTPPNWSEIELDQDIEITLRWRFVQPMVWKRDRSITLRITKRSYYLLLNKNMRGYDGGDIDD